MSICGENPECPSSRGKNNVVVVPDELWDGGQIGRYIHQNIDDIAANFVTKVWRRRNVNIWLPKGRFTLINNKK